MEAKDPIIEAEELISEITNELKKLKKASEQLEEANTRSGSLITITEKIVKKSNELLVKGNEIFMRIDRVDFPSKFNKLDAKIRENKKAILESQNKSSKKIEELGSNVESVSDGLKNAMFEIKGGLISKIEDNKKEILENQNKASKKIERLFLKKQKRDNLLYLVIIGLLAIILIINLLS